MEAAKLKFLSQLDELDDDFVIRQHIHSTNIEHDLSSLSDILASNKTNF